MRRLTFCKGRSHLALESGPTIGIRITQSLISTVIRFNLYLLHNSWDKTTFKFTDSSDGHLLCSVVRLRGKSGGMNTTTHRRRSSGGTF